MGKGSKGGYFSTSHRGSKQLASHRSKTSNIRPNSSCQCLFFNKTQSANPPLSREAAVTELNVTALLSVLNAARYEAQVPNISQMLPRST